MKDVGGKVEKQTDDFLTSREDLTFFYEDDSFSDTAFHSDISNGSIPDLAKSISSDVAVSSKSNSLKNWTDKLSCRCTDSSGTSCQLDWSSEQSRSYSDDRRKCNQEHYSKDADFTQSSCIRRGPTIFKDRDTDWANVSGFRSVSPDLSIINNRHDEDGHTQQHNNIICRNEQQCDGGVIRRPQRGRHLHWSFTHESLRPNTEWQTLEDLECCDSDIGSSDVESEESESLWSPSPEDVPSVRPDFVPKLDLSWVFEEETRKKKRSEKRKVGRRCAKKVSEINGHAFAKSLTTSMSSDSSPVEKIRSVKDKAKSLQFSECFGGAPCCIWEHRGQDEGAYVASAHYRLNHYDHTVDQTLTHKFRPHHNGSDDVRQAASACTYDDAPEMLDRTVWSAETRKDDEMIQMARCQLQPENTHCEPHFDGIKPAIRPSYQFQTSHYNSKNRSFDCRHLQKAAADSPSGIEDYEQPEQQKNISMELAACSFHANDTNGQGGLSDKYLTATKHLMKASHEYAVINRSHVPQLAEYYVVDEKSGSRKIRQRSLVAQHDTQESQESQEIQDAILQHTMLETNCSASNTYRLRRDDPPSIDLNFTSSTTCVSDSGLGADANSDSRISEFIKINAETTDSGQGDAVRESEGEKKEEGKETKVKVEHEEEEEEDQNMASNEPRSDELYDVEAAVFRRGRRQKLAKFVFCFIGCQTSCCKQTRCRPCYCDVKCDVKCFR